MMMMMMVLLILGMNILNEMLTLHVDDKLCSVFPYSSSFRGLFLFFLLSSWCQFPVPVQP